MLRPLLVEEAIARARRGPLRADHGRCAEGDAQKPPSAWAVAATFTGFVPGVVCWRRAGRPSRTGRAGVAGNRLAALVEPPEDELTGVVGGEFVLIAISCLLMSG